MISNMATDLKKSYLKTLILLLISFRYSILQTCMNTENFGETFNKLAVANFTIKKRVIRDQKSDDE